VSGNRRFSAVQELGWEEVECERVHLDDDEVAKYLVHFNKQRVKTCREILNEYRVLKNVATNSNERRAPFKLRETFSEEIGISNSQLGRLLYIQKEQEVLIPLIDKGLLTVAQAYLQTQRITNERKSREGTQEPPSPTNGSDDFTVYLKSSETMPEVSDGAIQIIFTSPPYWNKRKYTEEGGLGNEKTHQEYVDNLTVHLDDCFRVLNDSGSFFLNIGDTYENGNLLSIPHKVVVRLQERQKWTLRNTIIWKKTNPKPTGSKTNLTPTYEFIFHLVKGDGYLYNPTPVPLNENTKPSHPPRHRNIDLKTSTFSPYIPSSNGKNMGDYWDDDVVFSAVANQMSYDTETEHPAPFPEKIVVLPILQTSKEGDVVLDAFMGTGTTGRIANRLGRKFVGYDIQGY